MVILLIVSATIPWLLEGFFCAWMLRCRPQAEVNWPETAHEKSLVPPLRHILAKAASTRIRTFFNPRPLESALQRGNFWRTLNPDAFLSGDVTTSNPVLYREYCIQDGNLVVRFSQGRAICKFRALHNACSVANFPSGVLGTRVKPDTSRIRLDGQIRFDYGYLWTSKLLNPERKSCGYKNIRMLVEGA